MFKKIMAFLVSLFLTLSFTLNRAYTGINNPNNEMTITPNRFASENEFISMKRERERLPSFKEERANLPKPVWDGHDDIADEPKVEIRSDKPVTVEIFWNEGRQSKTLTVGG